MKQYGMIEPSIVECRRARSYVVVHDIISAIIAIIAIIAAIITVVTYINGNSIAIIPAIIAAAIILMDIVQIVCYHLSAKTTVLGLGCHFIVGHIGVLSDRNFVSPIKKIVAIERHRSLFDRLFGATTVRVRTSGGTVCRFSGMDADSVTKLFQVYQKYVVFSEQRPSGIPQNDKLNFKFLISPPKGKHHETPGKIQSLRHR